MKLTLLISMPLSLVACATKPARVVDMTARAVPGTTLPGDGIESVRYAENIKAYPLGRYVDPNNRRIMPRGIVSIASRRRRIGICTQMSRPSCRSIRFAFVTVPERFRRLAMSWSRN